MPMFEYHCAECERDFEELVRSAADVPRVLCAHCGSKRVARKLSVFAARSAASTASASVPSGGCGRCGDPSGPCGL